MKYGAAAVSLLTLPLLAETRLGEPLSLSEPAPIERVLADAEKLAGKTVQVRGKITEACQMMGCWMVLVDAGSSIRIKVNDGDIVFPKESVGKLATAEGKLEKLTLTREQTVARAKHEAEEQGRKFDPSTIKSGAVIYQIKGTGAVISD